MESSQWLSLALLCGLGAISPGPSLLVVVQNTLQSGRSVGLWTAWLHGLGIGGYALLVVSGLSWVFRQNPRLQELFELGGIFLLIWIAWQSWPRRASSNPSASQGPARNTPIAGLWIVVLNPKVALFFFALFSPQVPADLPASTQILLAAMAAGIDAGWYSLVVCLLSLGKLHQATLPWRTRIGQLLSLMLVLIALELLMNRDWAVSLSYLGMAVM